jgi:hypothetical protein
MFASDFSKTDELSMLSLDDSRWKNLDHRGWSEGSRSKVDPDAPIVWEELTLLLNDPSDIRRFRLLWPYLCSEGTTWAAAYAAVPYVIELAARLPPEQRLEHVYFVGLVAMCSCPSSGESFAIKPYLVDSYWQALAQAMPLLVETLLCHHNATDTRYLLAAAAALKGQSRLGRVLNDLDAICENCPKCGELVYPQDLDYACRETAP